MFLNRYCKKKAIEVFIRETIKDNNLTLDQKVQDIVNIKKKIKEIKHNPQIYKNAIEKIQNEWRKTDFHPGDVVQTKHGLDRGLVIRVNENNMPTEVMASPALNMRTGEKTELSYYGGVDSITWYKTGEHMTAREWNNLYSKEEGWKKYCEDRSNQIKFDIGELK